MTNSIVGRNDRSWWKHEHFRRFMGRQLPVLAKRGHGLIIDMHAGDGEATPHIQGDLFNGGALITTPHLALSMADRWGADVWLCEKSHRPRAALLAAYGRRAEVVANHDRLMQRLPSIGAYPWVIVLNDPNGHGRHGVEVMQAIARENPCSDFIINVNHHTIRRHLGVGAKDNTGNAFALAVEATKEHYAWMLVPANWAQRLDKRQQMATQVMRLSADMASQVILVSNFIPGYGR